MLSNIISLVSGCITFLGGFVVVWGAVSLGLAIKDETRGGAQIAGATSTIAGGAIIIAAAVYFGQLDILVGCPTRGRPCRLSTCTRTSASTRRRSSASSPPAWPPA